MAILEIGFSYALFNCTETYWRHCREAKPTLLGDRCRMILEKLMAFCVRCKTWHVRVGRSQQSSRETVRYFTNFDLWLLTGLRTNNALYTKATNLKKLVMHSRLTPKLTRLFESLTVSVTTVLGNHDPGASNQEFDGQEQTNTGFPKQGRYRNTGLLLIKIKNMDYAQFMKSSSLL